MTMTGAQLGSIVEEVGAVKPRIQDLRGTTCMLRERVERGQGGEAGDMFRGREPVEPRACV